MSLGYRIDLEEPILPRLDRKTRNTVRRAQRSLDARQGTLDELKALHWDPVYLPRSLSPRQHVFVATLGGLPVSAILLEDAGDHLVYRFAGNDRSHIDLGGNTLLLWWAAEHYRGKYRYIDLGGSAKTGIDGYKRRVSTSSYPLKRKPLHQRLLAKLKYHLKRLMR